MDRTPKIMFTHPRDSYSFLVERSLPITPGLITRTVPSSCSPFLPITPINTRVSAPEPNGNHILSLSLPFRRLSVFALVPHLPAGEPPPQNTPSYSTTTISRTRYLEFHANGLDTSASSLNTARSVRRLLIAHQAFIRSLHPRVIHPGVYMAF